MTRTALSLVLVVLACASASAQAPPAGHAAHQGQFQLRELPPPPLMDGIGDASLKITTNSDAAQAYFNQSLRLLHCFWDFEAAAPRPGGASRPSHLCGPFLPW